MDLLPRNLFNVDPQGLVAVTVARPEPVSPYLTAYAIDSLTTPYEPDRPSLTLPPGEAVAAGLGIVDETSIGIGGVRASGRC
ncbi:hypothetical protein AB0F71_16770 [Kitasatospora sp. NPDC028055]|uniref:hypothetical protein n=1 Tax=Kitasatospora sp. NPDC028055 TaxID=3155653 RepID=UPI0033C740BD